MDAQTTTSVTIHVIAVQAGPDDAAAGQELVQQMTGSDLRISGPEQVSDNPQDIRAALEGAIRASRAQCVIVLGLPPQGLRDVAADVVADSIERPLPGFGEQMRQLVFEEDPGAGVLSRSCAGIAGRALVVAMSGSDTVLATALRRLVLPAARRTGRDARASQDGMTSIHLTQPVARGWQAAVEALQGTLVRDAWPTLPSALADRAAVRAVFDSAGERGVLACANRRRYAVFGFPDLQRPTSHVLMTADGGRADYIIALHRFPEPVGILGPGAPPLLTPYDAATRQVCREIVGAPITEDGYSVFAVDRGEVFLEKDGAIGSWNGQALEDQGLPSQVGATLVLRWSQR